MSKQGEDLKEVSPEEARGLMCPYSPECQKCIPEEDMWRMIKEATPSIFGDYNELWKKLRKAAEKFGLRSEEWNEYVEKTQAILERLRANIVLKIMMENMKKECAGCSHYEPVDLQKLQHPICWETLRLVNAVFDNSGF